MVLNPFEEGTILKGGGGRGVPRSDESRMKLWYRWEEVLIKKVFQSVLCNT